MTNALKFSRVTSLVLALALFIQSMGGARLAYADALFSNDDLEPAIMHYLWLHHPVGPMPAPELTGVDREELADGLAEFTGQLQPEAFNDLLSLLLIQYKTHSEDRAPLEALFEKTRKKVELELREAKAYHPLFTFISDVFYVSMIVSVFGIGKGTWKARGAGLLKKGSWKQAAEMVQKELTLSRKAKLAVYGVGAGVGLIHIAIQAYETHRMDPREILKDAQDSIVTDLQKRIVGVRDEVAGINDDHIRDFNAAVTYTIKESRNEIQDIQSQLKHLMEVAPHLRARLDLVFQDMVEAQISILKIQNKLGAPSQEMMGGALP